MNKLPRSVRRISLIFFIYYISWGLLGPFLPVYFAGILGNYSLATAIVAFLYLFSIIWSIPLGDFSDIFSKRYLVRFFLILYLPMGFILAYISSFFHLILFRFYHSFSATGLWSSAESYIRVHSPDSRRAGAMGLFDLSYNLSVIFGAVLGGIIVFYFGIKTLFFLMPIFVLAAVFLSISLPDHSGSHKFVKSLKSLIRKRPFLHEFKYFLTIPGLMKISLLSFLFNFAVVGEGVILPFFSDSLGASPIQLGLIYALFSIPLLFEAPFAVLADSYDNKKMFIAGSLLSILFLLILFFAQDLTMLFLLSFFLGASLTIIVPVIEGNVTGLMAHHKVGELNGVYRSIVLIGMALGTFVVGPISDLWGVKYSFLMSAGIMFLFLVLALFLWPGIQGSKAK